MSHAAAVLVHDVLFALFGLIEAMLALSEAQTMAFYYHIDSSTSKISTYAVQDHLLHTAAITLPFKRACSLCRGVVWTFPAPCPRNDLAGKNHPEKCRLVDILHTNHRRYGRQGANHSLYAVDCNANTDGKPAALLLVGSQTFTDDQGHSHSLQRQ
ncbi:hypothetical protein BKA62DRAFT_712838 [Auriculariales sp. MPI-PUGE-AT-0066]|nr:hypothetical protein BKA62DRAFT_712838 [Auriculariales sp. MPI-PUGE-AT-0066]